MAQNEEERGHISMATLSLLLAAVAWYAAVERPRLSRFPSREAAAAVCSDACGGVQIDAVITAVKVLKEKPEPSKVRVLHPL